MNHTQDREHLHCDWCFGSATPKNTASCFTLSHLEPNETVPILRNHPKGEFQCSVELTAAQRVADHLHRRREISLRVPEQTLFVSLSFLHIPLSWHLQRPNETPGALSPCPAAGTRVTRVGVRVVALWGPQTGTRHIPKLRLQLRSQQPPNGILKCKHKLLF